MRRPPTVPIALAVALAATLVAGCGSTRAKVSLITVTQTAAQPTHAVSPSAPSTSTSTHTATTPSTSTTPPTKTSPSKTTATTPTAPASATTPDTGGLSAAIATVKGRGYTPSVTYSFHQQNTLSVIVGSRAANEEQAFFFVRGKYIGTDTSGPSAGIELVGSSDTSATLSYGLYRSSDALCCPSSRASVTYELDNGKLEPRDPIPSASASAPLSRR